METIYSLSGDVPPVDGAAQEDASSLWPGSLTAGSIRQVCSIRKISAGGAVLHVDHPVEVGERLELELMNGDQLDGTIAWHRGSEVGLRFDEPIDVFAIIAHVSSTSPANIGACRASSWSAALLETGSGTELVTTTTSQGGARSTLYRLTPDEPIRSSSTAWSR